MGISQQVQARRRWNWCISAMEHQASCPAWVDLWSCFLRRGLNWIWKRSSRNAWIISGSSECSRKDLVCVMEFQGMPMLSSVRVFNKPFPICGLNIWTRPTCSDCFAIRRRLWSRSRVSTSRTDLWWERATTLTHWCWEWVEISASPSIWSRESVGSLALISDERICALFEYMCMCMMDFK